jgi:hypothetical protein
MDIFFFVDTSIIYESTKCVFKDDSLLSKLPSASVDKLIHFIFNVLFLYSMEEYQVHGLWW